MEVKAVWEGRRQSVRVFGVGQTGTSSAQLAVVHRLFGFGDDIDGIRTTMVHLGKQHIEQQPEHQTLVRHWLFQVGFAGQPSLATQFGAFYCGWRVDCTNVQVLWFSSGPPICPRHLSFWGAARCSKPKRVHRPVQHPPPYL